MSSDQNYLQLRVLIQKHKDNQRIYKEKISEVNLTRAKIGDQLQILKQSYDKKIKNLQQKLENAKLQNESLLRQNVLFKTQIDTYQNRLLEKEKIIAVLLNQKRETLLIGNSERSKSDKTDSNQANEQQNKYFKKPIPVSRDSREEIQTGFLAKAKYDEVLKGISEVKQKPTIVEPRKDSQNWVQQTKLNFQLESPLQREQSLHQKLPPAKRSRLQQPKNPQIFKNQQNTATKLFQAFTQINQETQYQQKDQTTVQIKRKPPPVAHKRPLAKKTPKIQEKVQIIERQIHEQSDSLTQQASNLQAQVQRNYNQELSNHEQLQQAAVNAQTLEQQFAPQVQYAQLQQDQQEVEFNYGQHFSEGDNIVGQEKQIQVYQEQNLPSQVVDQPLKQEGQSYNNFLSHFTSHSEANEQMARASISPKAISRKKKPAKKAGAFSQEQHLEQDQSINSTDFFNQLNKHDHQVPHQLDIEESSIDHNDRDSSLISNQQHYFVQEQTAQKAKPVKMTKKKGKRDQIKVADPSLFE